MSLSVTLFDSKYDVLHLPTGQGRLEQEKKARFHNPVVKQIEDSILRYKQNVQSLPWDIAEEFIFRILTHKHKFWRQ